MPYFDPQRPDPLRPDWWSCDGVGHVAAPIERPHVKPTISRRGLLTGAALGAVGWASRSPAIAQLAVSPQKHGGKVTGKRDVLVSIFLRGGMDGLSVVVPHGEEAYYRLRPSLGLARPNDGSASAKDRCLDLDGFFGLNPSLAPLVSHYREGKLAFVHAVGSGDPSHSHFEAMDAMERGLDRNGESTAAGWLTRHLLTTPAIRQTPLRAVAFSNTLPATLSGATDALAVESIDEFKLSLTGDEEADFRRDLEAMYRDGEDALTVAGRETLEVLGELNRLNPSSYKPSSGAEYPKSDLGQALRQVAFLIRADVGLEVAVLDKGGWDTHVAQGSTGGWLAYLLDDVGKCLDAFARDLGTEMANVTVVAQTEFGRRAYENSGAGTDHGHGSAMMVLGGGVKGGKVYGHWPGLEDKQLDGPGDLAVTTDYRQVLSEVLQNRMSNPDVGKVFEGLARPALGLVSAR